MTTRPDRSARGRPVSPQLECGPGRELPVRLVDDHQPRGALEHDRDGLGRLGAARRVVGRAQEGDVGLLGLQEAACVVGVDAEVVVAGSGHDRRPGEARDVRVERVGRLEHRRPPPRAAEREQEGLEHLVGAVGAEDLVGVDAVQLGDRSAQLGGATVRVAVERDVPQGVEQLLAPGVGRRERGLVRVEADLRLDLGRVVALAQIEVRAHGGHAAHRLRPLLRLLLLQRGQPDADGVRVAGQALGPGQGDGVGAEGAQTAGRHAHRVHDGCGSRRPAAPRRSVPCGSWAARGWVPAT